MIHTETDKVSSTEFHITIKNSDTDYITLLAQQSGLSKQLVKQAMKKGAVWLTHEKQTQRLRRSKKRLTQGDQIHLYYNSDVLQSEVEAPILISDHQSYSIWYKPYGMLCQGSRWADHTTIHRCVQQLMPQRPVFTIHRLDRAATGLVLLGHTKKATKALTAQFESREIEKYYQVIVQGHFNHTDSIKIDSDVNGKRALSYAKLLSYDKNKDRSLVQVDIKTGRKHQIRVHMASIGYPIVGDRLHGTAESDEINLQLTSCFLGFTCPDSGEAITVSLPQQFRPQL